MRRLPFHCSLDCCVGINLPAHLVVIKSTSQYVAGKGIEDLSDLTLLQMAGRAGRPQFDDHGVCVIMTRYVPESQPSAAARTARATLKPVSGAATGRRMWRDTRP